MGFPRSAMVCVAQLEERLQQEGHQWALWQMLKETCEQPVLWNLEGKIAANDRTEVVDKSSGLRLRYVHDKPITIEASTTTRLHQLGKNPLPIYVKASYACETHPALGCGESSIASDGSSEDRLRNGPCKQYSVSQSNLQRVCFSTVAFLRKQA